LALASSSAFSSASSYAGSIRELPLPPAAGLPLAGGGYVLAGPPFAFYATARLPPNISGSSKLPFSLGSAPFSTSYVQPSAISLKLTSDYFRT